MRNDQQLEAIVKSMTLEEKVGQLFTFYNRNPLYSEFVDVAIREWKVGGIFLDMQSLQDPEQVHRLTSTLQETSLQQEKGFPLFIAADLVAGAGCKFVVKGGGATHFPKNKAVGACGDEELAYQSGRITAIESLEYGVNFNYSPVVDINNNPLNPVIGTHSFGEDAELVSRMGTAVIRGYQDHGMIATAKHFPGHGDTSVDSHFALPILSFDRARIEEFELEPFRRAIAAGVDAIMVGHIAVPSLDPSGLPATLSNPITTGILREQLGFEGLIVTDGMSMKGVTAQFSQADASVMALHAGADILLVCAITIEEGREIFERVLSAACSGELEESRIDASVLRILKAKDKYGLTVDEFKLKELNQEVFLRPEYEAVSLQIAQGAMEDVNGFAAALQTAATDGDKWTLAWDDQLTILAKELGGESFIADDTALRTYEGIAELLDSKELEGGRANNRLLVALTFNKLMKQDVLDKLNQYAASNPGQLALVHLGSQYDLAHLPDVPTLLLYDKAPSLQLAASEYIKNKLQA
jgi:beta-N-acetylhexosaminidase